MSKVLHRIYPFLIAVYPVLALRNFNSAYVDLTSIVRTLAIVTGLTAGLWLITYAFLRDARTAGVITSLIVIIFLSYGHIYIQLEKALGEPVRHLVLAGLFGGFFVAGTWLLVRKLSAVDWMRQFLSNTALILVLLTLGQSAASEINRFADVQTLSQRHPVNGSISLPDIYLIVLDGHGRSDVLKDEFDYNDSPFINELTKMGFYVASCSQSNYASTRYSLTSLFQMDYIQIVDGKEKVPALKNTPVLQTLRANGYTVITFENYASGHFDLGEDLRLSRNQLSLAQMDLSGGLNEFEKLMLNTSLTRLFLDTEIIPGFNEDTLVRLEDYEHYLQTKYILAELPEIPKMKSPKFVFVHLLVPHIPQIFTPDGNFRYPEDKSRNGYRDNAIFIDQAIVPVLREILAESQKPPVIILMGDHGPPATKFTSPEARMKNLNAYYVDSEAKTKLYDSITPINTFRVILNEYFGGDHPLLDDVSYYAYQFRQLKQSPTIIDNSCIAAP